MKAISPAVEAGSGKAVSPSLSSRALDWLLPDSYARLGFAMLLYCVASWGGNMLTRTPSVADLIWPANGLLLAFLLPIPRRNWASYLASSIVVNTLVHLTFGFSLNRSMLFSAGNTVEVLVAGSLLATRPGVKPDLTNLRTLARFLGFGVLLGPLTSTGFVEMVLSIWSYPRHFHMIANWLVGDVMGMALITPLFLAIDRRELVRLFSRSRRFETIVILLAIAVVSTAVFWQNRVPIDFLVIPMVLIAVFRLRTTGAALGILLIAAPAVYMTERFHGVFSLSGVPIAHGFFILQLFLCVNLVIVYAVSSAVNARDRLQDEMTEACHDANVKASVDYATGLANRMSFDRQLHREWLYALREQTTLSLLVVDVDHFKLYNEHYGHLAGDECLRRIANILSYASLRSTDMVARYGGEEFAIILPRASSQGAQALAERIRQSVADAQLPHLTYTPGIVTVSIGVATMHPEPGMDAVYLIHCADRALYSAKKAGRNRADVWEDCLNVTGD